jgi:hypothetical protein
VNHVWIAAKFPRLPRLLSWALTMMTILVTLVFFRSTTVKQAWYVLHRMFLPDRLFVAPAWFARYFPHLHIPTVPFLVLSDPQQSLYMLSMIVVLGIASVTIPALSAKPAKLIPSWRNGFAMAAMGWLVLGMISEPRSFLYFAF